ncbi:MAG: hypothetical protein KBC74_01995 [Candidatus Pacebacteria bacterium]|nr:hypothetical protein [Candidatus Paceibacterota bacterium]MBP9832277.1 hypothetical protein [Candidatus Paceibacterota bacterium]
MPEKPKRFPQKISLKALERGRTEYTAMCSARRGERHDWGTANAVEEFQGGEGSGGHVSILECGHCHKVIHLALTV